MKYNIYCDESCHLQNDGNDVMVLGSVQCPKEKARAFNLEINSLKEHYGISRTSEIKWTKVSMNKVGFYIALIDYFFDNPDLRFRGYIARGKSEIRAQESWQYNEWYYKMYYRTLEFILDQGQEDTFDVFIDIKDTIGSKKVQKMKQYFNNHYHKEIVPRMQLVDSSDIALLQLADLLIGALSYKHRKLSTSEAKTAVITRIEERSGQDLLSTVPVRYKKANWFVWVPDTWR